MGLQEENQVSRPLKQVLEGRFPARDVQRMNNKDLEKFVLKLIQYSIADGAKTKTSFISVCNGFNSKKISKPAWWPSDKILGPNFPPNSNVLLTNRLRLLVLKCAEFFRNSCDKFVKELYSDENCASSGQETEGARRSLRVRSFSKDEKDKKPKKLKTLRLKNFTPPRAEAEVSHKEETLVPSPPRIDISNAIFDSEVEVCFKRKTFIPLCDVLNSKAVKEVQDQTSFLGNLFGLSKNEEKEDSRGEKLTIPAYNNHVIKLTNSHNIPFSSDIGRMLIERDGHSFPESLRSRKYERLEWYVNKTPQRLLDIKYEVTYPENKKDSSYSDKCHIYKFPKRQFSQYQYPTKFQLEVCKPMKVVLRRDNLEELKKAWKTPRMLQIVLPKLARVKIENSKSNYKYLFPYPVVKYQLGNVIVEPPKVETNRIQSKHKQNLVFNSFNQKILKHKPIVISNLKTQKVKKPIKKEVPQKKIVKHSKLQSPVKKQPIIKKKVIKKCKVQTSTELKPVLVKKLQKGSKVQCLVKRKTLGKMPKCQVKLNSNQVMTKKIVKGVNVNNKSVVKYKSKGLCDNKKTILIKKSAKKISMTTKKKPVSLKTKKYVHKKTTIKPKSKGLNKDKTAKNAVKSFKTLTKLSQSKGKDKKLKTPRKNNKIKAKNNKGQKNSKMKPQAKSKSMMPKKCLKVLSKQQKLKQSKDKMKSKQKSVKPKVQKASKKKLMEKLKMKKLKVHCPKQGKPITVNKKVQVTTKSSKIRPTGKRKE